MPTHTYRVLGLMSGSSLDGLDIAYCRFDINTDQQNVTDWALLHSETIPFSEQWQARLAHLSQQSALVFAKTNTYFGYYMGELVHTFLQKHPVPIDFIASHGHTVFHHPDARFTTQIGNGAALAMTTRLPVCCDFRTSDIAINGEGTPLAPIADQMLFEGYDFYLNLGGIANISCRLPQQRMVAFDVGACNQVLNALSQTLGLPYDNNGQIAAEGVIDTGLFHTLNQLPYFEKPYPKSLDNGWVQQHIVRKYIDHPAAVSDLLRTACEQLAYQVQQATQQIARTEKLRKERYKLLLSGGGTFNNFLVTCLRNYCPNIDFTRPTDAVVSFKEAILIALLGVLRQEGIPNCLASVTGADQDTVGGAWYEPFAQKT